MRSRMGGLERAFLSDKLMSTVGLSGGLDSQFEGNVIEWTTLFRRNWDIYAEFYLGISLKPYQRDALHEIGISDTFFWRAGRGGAKSFITGLAALIKILLYPDCEVTITASTIEQANKIIERKIERELIKKLSPYLLYLYEQGWIKITKPTDGYRVENLLNNSTIVVLAPIDSSRGARSNFNIYDEVAVMKKSSIDQIFEGMLFPRQAKYLSNPKYQNNPRWLEESKAVYLTSSRFKYQWWYAEWKKCVVGYYTDTKTKYNIFASDFFDNIDNGLKTWGDYRRAKARMSEMDFRMEMLNEAVGEVDDAFFELKNFKDNQVLLEPFVPPTDMDVFVGKEADWPLVADNEVRLVVVDYAFANTTTKKKNANTIIMCMSLFWKGNYFERHLDYLEAWPGSDSIQANERVRELFWDYKANYLIQDNRNGGEALYNILTESKPHPNRGANWNPRGLTVASESKYQVVSDAKIQDLVQRTVDPNALPCIIPVLGTSEFNSMIWIELKKQLEMNHVKLLISVEEKQRMIDDAGDYYKMDAEHYADVLIPYIQTEELIHEAINLQTEIKLDKVRLTEIPGKTKDRIIVLAYGNYIASLIENEWNKQQNTEEENFDDVQLVW